MNEQKLRGTRGDEIDVRHVVSEEHRSRINVLALKSEIFDQPMRSSRLYTHSLALSSSPLLSSPGCAVARARAMHRRASASCTQVRGAHRRALISSSCSTLDASTSRETKETATEVRMEGGWGEAREETRTEMYVY